jgi:hypothetical protein
MDTRNDILKELQELHSALAGREVQNVFTVPDGYFEGFAGSVMRIINGDNILKAVTQPAGTDVPEGYFDTLAGNILSKIKLQSAAADNSEPGEALSPLMESLRHKNVFEVPEGYFEGFTGKVNEKLFAGDEMLQLPAALQGLQHKNVFEVPQGYFDGLAAEIMGKLKPVPAKLVNMRSSLRIIKYAVAAAFIGVMALGVYKFAQPKPVELTSVQKEGIALSQDAGKYNSEFEQVTDEAIVKFLETEGHDVDAALVAVAVDEKELPTEDELILDDKTLDNFLNDIDNKDLNN